MRMPAAGFCKHALWIYGVLIGLALKEAITGVVPHFLGASGEPTAERYAELARFIAFAFMSVRFYLGAAVVFEGHHSEALRGPLADDDEAQRLDRQFGADFLCGLIHFGLFSVWSLTLPLHGQSAVAQWAYRDLLIAVLLWDVVWVAVRPGRFDGTLIYWAAINAATALIVSYWYWSLLGQGWTDTDAEIPPLMLVSALSAVDITGTTMRTRLVIDVLYNVCRWLYGCLPSAIDFLGRNRRKQ
jgi:hypothetical protein